MSWGTKQRRKAIRGNSTAQTRLNIIENNETQRIKQFQNKGFKACVSRSLYEKQGVLPVVSHVERLTKSINGKSQNEICVIDLRKFNLNKRTFGIDKENFSLIKNGYDYLKATRLSSIVWTNPNFMDKIAKP